MFRPFHESFSKYLRTETADEGVEQRFADALLATLPSDTTGRGCSTEPYLRRHLPAHLLAAGYLNRELQNPAVVLNVAPDALLAVLPQVSGPEERKVTLAYHWASRWMDEPQTESAPAYLAWGAFLSGADALASGLLRWCENSLWKPAWGVYDPSVVSQAINTGEQSITAAAVGTADDGDPLVATGHTDGTVALWNLRTRRREMHYTPTRLRPKTFGGVRVSRLLMIRCGTDNLIAAVWNNGGSRL